MQELRFERSFAAPPPRVWPFLVEPALMNLWSEAQVEALGGDVTIAGARRAVTVRAFGLSSRLEEEIIESDPPRRLAYRVVAGGALRDHLGTIELTARDGGTRLVWRVRFRGRLPGTSGLLAAVLRPRLGRSLDALVEHVDRSR